MTALLKQLRLVAFDTGRLARQHNADKLVVTITLEGDERYLLTVERLYRNVGRGAQKRRELKAETVTVRDRSAQGAVLFASPLEWLLDGE